jgi:hypothetical protein
MYRYTGKTPIREIEYQDGTIVASPEQFVDGSFNESATNRIVHVRFDDGSVWNPLAAENAYLAG